MGQIIPSRVTSKNDPKTCFVILSFDTHLKWLVINPKNQCFFVLFFQINNDVSAVHWAVWPFCTWCCTEIKPFPWGSSRGRQCVAWSTLPLNGTQGGLPAVPLTSQPALGKLRDPSSIITWGRFYLELWRLEGFWQAPLTQRPHVAALGEGRPFHHRLHWIMDKFLKDQQWALLYCKNPNVHNLSSNSSLSRSPFCLRLL